MPYSLFDLKRKHAKYAGKKMKLFTRLQSLLPTVEVGDSKIKTLLCTIEYIEKVQYHLVIPAALEASLSTRVGKEWKKKIIEESLEDAKRKIIEEYAAEGDGGENVQT
jgi:hypothetical protein